MNTNIHKAIGRITIALVALFELATTPANLRAATLTVTNTADSGAGTLRAALASAANGDTINFSLPTPTKITLTSGELLVSKNVTIIGPSASNLAVDGNGASRVFHIAPSNTVAICSLTVTNGFAPGSLPPVNAGGGIANDHSTLTVSNCTVTGNSAEVGGGIFNYGEGGSATLTISASTISGNSAYSSGGIYNDGGGGGSATLTVIASTLNSNHATFGNAGGIYNDGGGGAATMTISASTLSDNSANSSGGGIFNWGVLGGATVTISASTINSNSAGYSGGGLYNHADTGSATLNIVNSTFSQNLKGAIVSDSAGAFPSSKARVQIISCTFSTNTLSSIANSGGGSVMLVTNSTIIGHGTFLNDGIGNDYNGVVSIYACTINGSSVQNGGNWVATASIVNSTLVHSTVNNRGSLTMTNSTLSDTDYQDGEGQLGLPASAVIVNSTLVGRLHNYFGTLQIGSTILDYPGAIANDFGKVISLGYNLSSDDGGGFLTNATDLINTDPMLGPLQDNGGPTFTHAFTCHSPAIDAGKNFSASATDQRGLARIFDDGSTPNAMGGDGTDIGAFEAQQPLSACNYAPVADASATVPLVISGNGSNATVILDASRSSDPDADVLQYTWSEAGNPFATGVVALAVLPVSTHTLTLVVSDGMLSNANGITVDVITAAEAVNRLAVTLSSDVPRPQPLLAALNAAIGAADRNNPTAAINQLLAFQNKVRAQVEPIDPALAASLIQSAQAVIDALSGGNTNPGGHPHGKLTSVSRQSSGRVRVQYSGEPARTYIVEASANMTDWEKVGVATSGPDGSLAFEDAHAARFAQRFYRVVLP